MSQRRRARLLRRVPLRRVPLLGARTGGGGGRERGAPPRRGSTTVTACRSRCFHNRDAQGVNPLGLRRGALLRGGAPTLTPCLTRATGTAGVHPRAPTPTPGRARRVATAAPAAGCRTIFPPLSDSHRDRAPRANNSRSGHLRPALKHRHRVAIRPSARERPPHVWSCPRVARCRRHRLGAARFCDTSTRWSRLWGGGGGRTCIL